MLKHEHGVSIVVCCFNSAARLEETLGKVFKLKIPEGVSAEVILVNNNSSDNTVAVAELCFKNYGRDSMPLRVLNELMSGHSYARMTGIKNAIFDLILFCDDDNHLESDYFMLANNLLRENPEIGIVGGWSKPKLSNYPGKWLDANLPSLAIELTPKEEGYKDWVFGAGMVIRKQIFDELQSKDVKLLLSGRRGKRQTSGDDAEICILTRFLGYKIYYSPMMILYHKVAMQRLTRWNFLTRNYRDIYSIFYLDILDAEVSQPAVPFKTIYSLALRKSIRHIFYFFPRTVMGKNNFYSLIMLNQGFRLLFWTLFRKQTIHNTYTMIRNNLRKV